MANTLVSLLQRRGKIYYSFLVSAVLIVIIPIALIATIINLFITRSINEDYINMNSEMMSNLCVQIDESIVQTVNRAYELSENASVEKLLLGTDFSKADTANALLEVLRLSLPSDPNSSLNIIPAVYFPTRGFAVMNGRIISRDIDSFYNTYISFENKNAAEFYETVINTLFQRYLPAVKSSSSSMQFETYLCVIQRIPFPYFHKHAYLLSFINVFTLDRMILSNTPRNSLYAILAPEGTQVYGSAGLITDDGVTHILENNWPAEVDGKKYIAYNHLLPKSSLRIVFYIPESTILENMMRFQGNLLMALLLITFAGIIAALFLTHRQYSPLMRLLKLAYPEGYLFESNEYDLIATKIGENQMQNEVLTEENKRISSRLLNDALINLFMFSHKIPEQEIYTLLLELDCVFTKPRFHVIFLENYPPEDIKLTNLVSCHLSSSDIVLIVNDSLEEELLPEVINSLESFCDKSKQVIIGVSNPAYCICALSTCFHEATLAAKIKNEEGRAISSFSDAAQYTNSIYYPMDKEVQIMTALHDGNFELCKKLIVEIRKENEENRKVSPALMRCLYQNMISTAYRVYDSMSMEEKGPLLIALQALCPAIDDESLFGRILEMYHTICETYRRSQDLKKIRLMNQIVLYIQENSADPELTLNVISDKFGVSYYYLSRMFHEATGKNFTEILNKSRVKRSIELLSETSCTVQQIAKEAGFTNLNTFLRAFRKETGTTPKKYKNLSNKNSDINEHVDTPPDK